MATKSASDEAPETTTLEPEQNQPQPEATTDPASFPKSLADTVDQIAADREEIRRLEANVAQSQAEINRLQNEIAVLNSLRQIHGQGTL